MAMRDLREAGHATRRRPRLSISRTGTGRVYYTARAAVLRARGAGSRRSRLPASSAATSRTRRTARAPATTSFTTGDLVRVTVAVTIRGEGRYLALTDPLPAGFEPIDGWFKTTARDLAREATRGSEDDDWWARWRRGRLRPRREARRPRPGLRDAARLGPPRVHLSRARDDGRHVRVAGARVEAMYAPELEGRARRQPSR